MPALMADKVSGLHAAYATIAGLFARNRMTKQGQFIEVPDARKSFTAFNLVENLYGHTFNPPMAQMAYTRSSSINRMPYPTKDGYIGIMPYSDKQWVTFFELGGRPEVMTTDPRFSTYNARTANIGALYQLVGEVAATKTTDEWLDLLGKADIPVRALRHAAGSSRRPASARHRLHPRAPAPCRIPLHRHGASGEVHRHARGHPPRAAAAGRAHGRCAAGTRLLG